MEGLAKANEIKLEMFDHTLNIEGVSGDDKRLQQIIFHLVHNSIKFSRPGSKVKIILKNLNDGN